jgi:hypothetical protein
MSALGEAMINRTEIELVIPLIHKERLRKAAEARRAASAQPASTGASTLALRLGSLLIRAGCRLDAVGRQRAAPMASLRVPAPCASLR